MKKLIILWIGFILILLNVNASNILYIEGDNNRSIGIQVNTITEKGAWCCFADPRVLNYLVILTCFLYKVKIANC
jgi:hypothetical protein